MKAITDSNLFMVLGLIVLIVGGIEIYQTSVSPRIHGDVSYGIN